MRNPELELIVISLLAVILIGILLALLARRD